MPYWVYILQNYITGKLYKGQTSDLERRIEQDNTHESGSLRYKFPPYTGSLFLLLNIRQWRIVDYAFYRNPYFYQISNRTVTG